MDEPEERVEIILPVRRLLAGGRGWKPEVRVLVVEPEPEPEPEEEPHREPTG